MEPNYERLDPEERINKYLALASVIVGFFSLCAGLIPICGAVVSLTGIGFGVFGRRSESRKLATVGVAVNILGLIVCVVYGIMIAMKGQ